MDRDIIRDVGNALRSQRADLNTMKIALQTEADQENDEFKAATKQRLSKYAAILENQYEYIQNLLIGQMALRMQIETLKNVIFTLPDVMSDPELKRKIDSILKRMRQRRRMFGMTFHDRQAITVNVERKPYKELQDLCRQERRTLSELIHSFFISKLESSKDSK